jgi:hypothetical protein
VDIDMFDGIRAGDRLGAVRELMQSGELEGALAEVDRLLEFDRLIGLEKSAEVLALKSEIFGRILARNQVVVPEVSAEPFYNRAMQYYLAGDFKVALDTFGSMSSFAVEK